MLSCSFIVDALSSCAERTQQARNDRTIACRVLVADSVELARHLLDRLGQRRIGSDLPEILRAELHPFEHFFITRNLRVNRPRQRMTQLLLANRMIRDEAADH